ncbi:MAG TPA: sulfatase-like hydrolase/transferase [Sphingomonadaceae bacterium]|nr:sulfatase-like hydrolase/transferase [Sphingomonadaceae bacterium]
MVSNSGKFSISRRTAVAGLAGTAALASLPGCSRESGSPAIGDPIEGKPNFLFIMADDLGYADLSCYGRIEYETPALDKLASEGMQFMHGYANSAVCSATRFGLITGRYQYRLRAGLEEPLGGAELGLDPAHPTLPSLLKQLGYHTALVGKWHLGLLPTYGPLKSGYDEFWGNRGGGVDYYTHAIAGSHDVWDGDDPAVEDIGYYTDLLGDRSVEYLEARAQEDKPWLLSLHFTAPHWPWQGNDEAGKAESDRIAGLSSDTGELTILHYDGGTMETYGNMVKQLDANIGRVLEKLVELGMDKNTVVVFTSDNGGERFSFNWPFHGQKTELLEGGIRVPWLVKWPGLAAPGSKSDAQIMSMDMLPTFLAAAGGAPHPDYPTDGVDIRPALEGGTLPERNLYWRFHSKDQKAVRSGDYKYLSINGNEFLFNIVEDPQERGNLKDRLPDKFEELKQAYIDWDAPMVHANNVSSFGNSPANMAERYDPNP